MSGPTAWLQQAYAVTASNQSIPDNSEAVIATLAGINSRGPGAPVALVGLATFAVAAATTSTRIRIRIGSLTGTLLGQAQIASAAAGNISGASLSCAAVDTPAGEYASQSYVLTVQSAAAGGAWNVTLASLSALF